MFVKTNQKQCRTKRQNLTSIGFGRQTVMAICMVSKRLFLRLCWLLLLCEKTIQCGHYGDVQILHHAEGQTHKNNTKMKISTSSTRLFFNVSKDKPATSQGGGDVVAGSSKETLLLTKPQKDQVITAEIL